MDITTILAGWRDHLIGLVPNLLFVALILVLTSLVSRRTTALVTKITRRTPAPPELVTIVSAVVRVGIVLVGVFLALNQLGWSAAAMSLLGSLGIAGVVAGLALQDVAKQFIAGALLLTTRPFRVGEHVRIRAFEGVVLEMELYTTRLRTTIGEEVILPNTDVITAPIVNLSRSDSRLRSVTLKVPRGADLALVRETAARLLGATPGVSQEPSPSVVEIGFDKEVTRVTARFWVDSPGRTEHIAAEVLVALRDALDHAGVTVEGEIDQSA